MARIDGPKLNAPTQLERRALEPLATVAAPAGLISAKTEAPSSEFVDRKAKLVSTTGGYRPVPIPDALRADLKSFVADQLRGGVRADASGGTLAIKKGDVTAAPKAATPQSIEKALAKLPMNELMGKLSLLSPAESAALGKAIQAGKMTNPRVIAAFLELQVPGERAKSMSKLSGAQIEQMKVLMRAGDCPDNVAVGVGIRLAKETKWGKAPENAAVVKKLEESFSTGMIRMAQQDREIPGLGMSSVSGIDLATQLRKSPEALAATLAHEGVHQVACVGCSGGGDATPQGEIDGMAAGNEVWTEIGNPNDPNLKPGSRAMLNDLSAAKKVGDKEFKHLVLGWYHGFYQRKAEALQEGITKGDAKFKRLHDLGRRMDPDELDKLMSAKNSQEHFYAQAATFEAALKANDK
jgi:hypothetical protein